MIAVAEKNIDENAQNTEREAKKTSSRNQINAHRTQTFKRIPLDVKLDYYYSYIEPHARAIGSNVNALVKRALLEKMYRIDHDMDDLADTPIRQDDLTVYTDHIDSGKVEEEMQKRKEKSEKYSVPVKELKSDMYAIQLTEYAQRHPLGFTSSEAVNMLDGAYPTVQAVIKKLVDEGVLISKHEGKQVFYIFNRERET